MRSFLSVIFYSGALFCFYMFGLTSFISTQTVVDKWSALLAFSAVGAVLFVVALALGRFKNWRFRSGLLLLIACLVVCGVIFAILIAPGISIIAGAGNVVSLKDFGDYRTGGLVLALYLVVAAGLVLWHAKVTNLKMKIDALKQRVQRL
ncbi:hypothetical protein [Neisseria dumasiana]|uniref:Uncharacterized protein n=1 Tax=Neisseria dumasiana TaxID=1931275 RepID=A0A1X3DL95_9NEIS|nr:hypothetical protein [Neisseria dumasiana]OSI25367.1 hypothetical protein BV912_00375 [Neisseria dumasiana]